MMPFVALVGRRADDDMAGLLDGLRRGDSGALERVYRQESPAVYRYALALSGNPAWAADAMQDAFVDFAGRPEGFDAARGSLGAYLAGMARHALLARWREGRGQVDGEALEQQAQAAEEAGEASSAPSPEALLVRAQDQALVWAAIQQLPWPFREALVLVDLQERAYAEAAQIAGVELNTLRTRLHRARSRLAALLNAGEPR